mmetsp:Transcript_25462/g.41912  ORF Transcript_25462/g.41912 Transcript_25462/m.41912 type:complete len:85 (-) Transcript_25462:380-634(-)
MFDPSRPQKSRSNRSTVAVLDKASASPLHSAWETFASQVSHYRVSSCEQQKSEKETRALQKGKGPFDTKVANLVILFSRQTHQG